MTDYPAIPDDNRVLFYKRDRSAFGFLSHFHPSPVLLDGETWPTVKHYYQAQKSFERDYRAAIRACATPARAKRRAATSRGPRWLKPGSWFLEQGKAPRPDWAQVKLDVMWRADFAKYAQNRELAQRLRATGEADLVEDSRSDPFWGVGRDGDGLNWAGRILMAVRAGMRGAAASPVDDARLFAVTPSDYDL